MGGGWVLGSSPQPFCPQCCAPPFLSTLSLPRAPSGAPRFLWERVVRKRPVAFGSAFCGSAPLGFGGGDQGKGPRQSAPFPSGATLPRYVGRAPSLSVPSAAPHLSFPLSPSPAPFPSGARSSGAPRFPSGALPTPSVEPPALMSPVLPPPLLNISPSLSRAPPFFVPSVTTLAFTYLLSAQFGSEQRFKDNPERQTRKTQDEPQWIVAQRRLSARTIPGFS